MIADLISAGVTVLAKMPTAPNRSAPSKGLGVALGTVTTVGKYSE